MDLVVQEKALKAMPDKNLNDIYMFHIVTQKTFLQYEYQ